MDIVFSVILILGFLSVLGVLLSALFWGKSFSASDLLEELASKHQGKLCYSGSVELPLPFGSMLVSVGPKSMLGTSRISPRATISIQSTYFQDLPEFRIHSKYSPCGYVHGFKKASCKEFQADKNFSQKWCIFVHPEVSSQQVNTLLKQLKSPLTKLNRQALSPQWGIVNISCQGQKIDFLYSKSIYEIDSLEILMKASVGFVQALIQM
jgi:hypothetical protein